MPHDVDELAQSFDALLKDGTLPDVTLVVGDRRMPAHRRVLAAQSDYFKTMFTIDLAERRSNDVILNDTSPAAFQPILNYAYTGKLDVKAIDEQTRLEVLELSHRYQFLQLQNAMATHLAETITIDTVCEWFNIAELLNIDILKNACLEPTLATKLLLKQELVDQLSSSVLESVLALDNMQVPEIGRFQAVCGWIEKHREVDARPLLSRIRLSLLTMDEIYNIVRPTNHYSESEIVEALYKRGSTLEPQLPHRLLVRAMERGTKTFDSPAEDLIALYPSIRDDIERIEQNWHCGHYALKRINCRSEASKGVYCLQYDDEKIVSGLRDNTIKIWDRRDLTSKRVLTGHTGSVLCLQYDKNVIISGSSDATVRVWDVESGQHLNTLIHHCEAVLHLRFQNGIMVTCSKDRSIAVWDMVNAREINLRRVLVGHRAAVNVVDFDSTFIVSASGDRTIKVWSADTYEFVRTLSGHKRGIACMQYRDRLVVSGSGDNTIRLWDIISGQCLRTLEGHDELVRCVRFDSKRIVSGAYDGKIKVWDLVAAMDPRSNANALCLTTLAQHTGRVFRLQFDEFQIVSSSQDDTIIIWDFLDEDPLKVDEGHGGGAGEGQGGEEEGGEQMDVSG